MPGEISLKIEGLHRSRTLTATEFERVMKFVLNALPVPFRDRAPPVEEARVAD